MTMPAPQNRLVVKGKLTGEDVTSAKPNFSEFPKWKYHDQFQARTVMSAEQEKALGDGWRDTPNKKQADPVIQAAHPELNPSTPEQPAPFETITVAVPEPQAVEEPKKKGKGK